jgi:hypothetical protein
LRSEGYLYVEYPDAERELYDLRRDPFELHNGYADAAPSARFRSRRSCDEREGAEVLIEPGSRKTVTVTARIGDSLDANSGRL